MGFVLAVSVAMIVIIAPLFLVVWLSFFSNEILALPPDGYSLRWYHALLGQPQFLAGFQLSAIVALLATALGLLVTVPAAFALTRASFPGPAPALRAARPGVPYPR